MLSIQTLIINVEITRTLKYGVQQDCFSIEMIGRGIFENQTTWNYANKWIGTPFENLFIRLVERTTFKSNDKLIASDFQLVLLESQTKIYEFISSELRPRVWRFILSYSLYVDATVYKVIRLYLLWFFVEQLIWWKIIEILIPHTTTTMRKLKMSFLDSIFPSLKKPTRYY